MKWTVLVADDEPLARKKIRAFLADVAWVGKTVEAKDGLSTLKAINTLHPDLALLDIRMPGMTALEVLRETDFNPRVIFTTAYDRYAVAAFELHAVDYLLKPFGRERFLAALDRARHVRQDPGAEMRIQEALKPDHLSRLFVRERGRIIPVAVDQIIRIEADGDYSMVFTGHRKHLVHVTMNELERRLDPGRFLRIHRSHLVNLDFVEAMIPSEGSRLRVDLEGGSSVMASRRRSREIRGFAV